MKRLALLALAVVAVVASFRAVYAQEFAPLVQSETVSIVRVNLDAVDSTLLGNQVQKLANAAVDYFNPDKEKAQELKQATPLAKMFAIQYFASFVQPFKDAGAKCFYVVIEQPESSDETLYPYVAFPIEKLSKDQLDALRSAAAKLNSQLDSAFNYRFVRNGFFFMPVIPDSVDEAEAKAYVKERFQKMKTVERPEYADGFKLVDSENVFLSGVSLSAKNEKLAKSQVEQILSALDGLEESDLADAVGEFVKYASETNLKCADLVKFSAWKVDLKELALATNIQAVSEDAAKEYAKIMSGEFNDKLVAFLRDVYEKAAADSDFPKDAIQPTFDAALELVPLFTTYDVNGDALRWSLDAKFFETNKPLFDKFVQTALQTYEQLDVDSDDDELDEDEDEDVEEEADASDEDAE